MKRDPEILREMLLQVEASSFSNVPSATDDWKEFRFPSVTHNILRHHAQLLLERGFLREGSVILNAPDFNGRPVTTFLPDAMTDHGHEFLESVRDPEIWRKTKSGAENVGSFNLDLLKQIALGLIKTKLKAHTGLDMGA